MRNGMMMTAIAAALAVASAAALAHGGHGAGAWMAGGDCPMMGSGAGMRGERMPEIAAQRLAGIKDALKLQPGQVAAWDAFETKARSTVEARAKMRADMLGQRGNADATVEQRAEQRAEQRVAMMKFNAQAAEEMLAARRALVAVLTPEQKATFDQFGHGMGPMARGPAGEWRGPGMGRGFGPGTPGASPCCPAGSGPAGSVGSVHSGA